MKRLAILLPAAFLFSLPAEAQSPAGSGVQAAAELGLRFLYKADADQDTNITRQEFKDFRSREFNKADRDRDGAISLKDIPARYQTRVKSAFESGEVVAAFDSNGDSQVSRVEFEAGPTLIFDHADADHDGTVTQTELIDARTAVVPG